MKSETEKISKKGLDSLFENIKRNKVDPKDISKLMQLEGNDALTSRMCGTVAFPKDTGSSSSKAPPPSSSLPLTMPDEE